MCRYTKRTALRSKNNYRAQDFVVESRAQDAGFRVMNLNLGWFILDEWLMV